ncbi:hypothetical protein [Amycolatopsis sacchari]|uniref:hypothetical protein n=1 Tax=Amycolatopsis sacchari TaxID=115433 RepID=UPI003D72CB6B
MNKGFVLRFSPDGLRRFAEGTKRATVLRATQAARLRVGQLVTATVAGAGLDRVRLPLRIEQLHELPNLGALPAAARRVGVRLADFTTLPDWPSYQRAASRGVPGAAALVVLAPAGPVAGTIPDKPIRQRATPDSIHGRSWHRVTGAVTVHPADQVHDGDRDELRTRLAAAIRAGHPDRDDVRVLAPVTDALLRSGRCGPAHLGRPHRRRLARQLEPALVWLAQHGLLTGDGPDRTWSRDLLAGLRINHDDRPPTPNNTTERHSR